MKFLMPMLLAACGSCVSIPFISPAARPLLHRDETTVRVEAFCVAEDPFADATVPLKIKGGYGSGVIINSRQVLTAYHVAGCPYLPDIHVITSEGKRLRMVVEWESPENDLARLVIQSADTFGPVAPPVVAPVIAREFVCLQFAYPGRGGSCGQVSSLNGDPTGDVEITAEVHHGNSGGPVYNTDGDLVGIVTKLEELDGEPYGGDFVSLWRHPEAFR